MRRLFLVVAFALSACGAAAPPEAPGGPDLSEFWSN